MRHNRKNGPLLSEIGSCIRAALISYMIKKSDAQQIYKACESKKWLIRHLKLKFCGSTSVYLKKELQEVFHVVDDRFVEDAAFANVLGFLMA